MWRFFLFLLIVASVSSQQNHIQVIGNSPFPVPDRQMELFIPFYYQEPFFEHRCDQKILPNRDCFCVELSQNGRDPLITHKHLTFIMYYNLIERIPLFSFNNRMARIYTKSDEIFKNVIHQGLRLPKSSEKVPRIMHKFWITHHEDPYNVPESLWDMLREFLNELEDIEMYIWVMDVEVIRPSLTAIKRIDPKKIVIKRARELLEMMTPGIRKFFDEVYEARKLTKASDLLRLYALYQYGGVFTDMDLNFKKEFLFTLNYEMSLFIFRADISYLTEVYFIACKKEHPAFLKFFRLWEAMRTNPEIEGRVVRIIEDLGVHWHLTFMYAWSISVLEVAFEELKRNEETKTLFFSKEEEVQVITHKNDLSWQRKKYGNANEFPMMFNFDIYDDYINTIVSALEIRIVHTL